MRAKTIKALGPRDGKAGFRRSDGHGSLLESGDARTVARYLARERQKQALRSERDVLVLALAGRIGEQTLAERLDVTQDTAAKLLAGARDRLSSGSSSSEPMMAVARPVGDQDRRADLDTYYEALGARPRFALRRSPSPPS